MNAARVVLLLASSILLVPSAARAEGAEIIQVVVDEDACFPVTVDAPPDSGLPPIQMTHCFSLDGVLRIVVAPSGNTVERYQGDMSIVDTDADGYVMSEGWLTDRVFELEKVDGDSSYLHLRRSQSEQCVDSPWGYSVNIEIHELQVDGEWTIEVYELSHSYDPC